MGNRRDRSLGVSVVVVSAVVGVGLFAYVKFAPSDEVPSKTVTIEQQSGGGGVRVLTPYYKGDDLAFRSETIEVPPNVDPHVFAVNRYLRSVKAVAEKAEVMTVTIKNGVADLDFNSDFATSYGTFDESTIVNGLAAVMGQFSDVSHVRLLLEGRPIDTLGNADLTDPFEVTRLPQASGQPTSDKTAKT